MPDKDDLSKQTFLQKLLFYTTAFFILLGTFSLFAFLFLVPFVIDPAFTTIFMDFDVRPAECITIDVDSRRGEESPRSRNQLWLIYRFFFFFYPFTYNVLFLLCRVRAQSLKVLHSMALLISSYVSQGQFFFFFFF